MISRGWFHCSFLNSPITHSFVKENFSISIFWGKKVNFEKKRSLDVLWNEFRFFFALIARFWIRLSSIPNIVGDISNPKKWDSSSSSPPPITKTCTYQKQIHTWYPININNRFLSTFNWTCHTRRSIFSSGFSSIKQRPPISTFLSKQHFTPDDGREYYE